MSDKILAIDFGTSNTYLSVCPVSQVTPSGIDLHRGEGIASAVLHLNSHDILIGSEAVEEWYDATDSERLKYKISTHFKPDIATNERAYSQAQIFLTKLKEKIINEHIIGDLSDYCVHVGIPSNKHDGYLTKIKRIAYDSGFGEINAIEESIGALLYHLWSRSISPDQARKGILVIDFGGGTCDFAYLVRLDVKYTWGDSFYGGRIFDDLFYQIFIEQNPSVESRLNELNAKAYVQWFCCKEAKENFSRKMKRDRSKKVRLRIGDYGFINELSWNHFCEKTTRHEPSKEFAEYLGTCTYNSPEEYALKGDLIKKFEEILLKGLEENSISKNDISKVILTGGGSQWLFIEDIVKQHLFMEDSDIIQSDKPFAAISMGLSLLPALQNKYESSMNKMKSNKKDLVLAIKRIFDEAIISFSSDITEEIILKIFEPSVIPPLKEYRGKGGKLSDLKQNIQRELIKRQDCLKQVIEKQQPILDEQIASKVNEILKNWFEEHDITVEQSVRRLKSADSFQTKIDSPKDLSDKILQEISVITGIVLTAVIASICGGGGWALIASGPIGIIIGIIIAALALFMGKGVAEQYVEENVSLPAWLTKRIISDSKIETISKNAKEGMTQSINDEIIQKFNEKSKDLESKISEIVDKEIDSIDEINNI